MIDTHGVLSALIRDLDGLGSGGTLSGCEPCCVHSFRVSISLMLSIYTSKQHQTGPGEAARLRFGQSQWPVGCRCESGDRAQGGRGVQTSFHSENKAYNLHTL